MASVVGQGSAAATSVAIPTHQVGDMILVFARGTAAAPTVPAAGGTVPAWVTLQTGFANSIGLTACSFVATATTTTTGTWTNATHICVLVLRPAAGQKLQTQASFSSAGSGNNTQTIVYPALTFIDLDGSSWGVRCGTRTVAITAVGTPPTGWTNQTIQPAGASALMSVHTRSGITTSPVADTVSTAGTNAAYRAVTVEVQEVTLNQTVAVTGLASPQSFGSRPPAAGPVSVSVQGLFPGTYVPSITGLVTSGDGHVVGGVVTGLFGAPNVAIGGAAQNVPVTGVPTAQSFGAVTIKAVRTLAISGVPSAQAFGAVTIKTSVRVTVGGVASAQQVGTPTVQATTGTVVGGVPSAQAFGTVTAKTPALAVVGGVPTAQSFGAVTIRVGGQSFPATGVSSAQAFGVPKLNVRTGGGGVPSAQQFGQLTFATRVTVQVQGFFSYEFFVPSITGEVISGDGHVVGGLGGPQSLIGKPTIHATINVPAGGGVPSAQAFGVVKTAYIVHPDPVPSAQDFGRPQINIRFGVGGVPSAQQFGKIRLFRLHVTCKPEGGIAAACKPEGTMGLPPSITGGFTITPRTEGGFVLTPRTDGDVTLTPVFDDG